MKPGKFFYVAIVLLIAAVTLSFQPGMWLVHKPANSESEHYVKGWEDGCISGTNTYSLLYAPLLDKPFIKALDPTIKPGEPAPSKDAANGKDLYKTGWNEGFTLCRFYQSSVYELMQFAILIATLLFIGYVLVKRKV